MTHIPCAPLPPPPLHHRNGYRMERYTLSDGVHMGLRIVPDDSRPGVYDALTHLYHLGDGPSDAAWPDLKSHLSRRLICLSPLFGNADGFTVGCNAPAVTHGIDTYRVFYLKHPRFGETRQLRLLARERDDAFAPVPRMTPDGASTDTLAKMLECDLTWH